MLWATPLWHLTIKKKNDRGRKFFCGSRTLVRGVSRNRFLPSIPNFVIDPLMPSVQTAEKSPTGRFFWKVRIVCPSGGFSLTKAPSFSIQSLDWKIHPQRRLTMRVEQVQLKCSALCGVRQRALPFWNPPPFEKGGRKLQFHSIEAFLHKLTVFAP